MTVHVVWNTIRNPEKKVASEKAVLEALASRPEQERWDVKLTESDAVPGWTAVVVGPRNMKVAWYFHGRGEEDSPPVVRERIEMLLRSVGL